MHTRGSEQREVELAVVAAESSPLSTPSLRTEPTQAQVISPVPVMEPPSSQPTPETDSVPDEFDMAEGVVNQGLSDSPPGNQPLVEPVFTLDPPPAKRARSGKANTSKTSPNIRPPGGFTKMGQDLLEKMNQAREREGKVPVDYDGLLDAYEEVLVKDPAAPAREPIKAPAEPGQEGHPVMTAKNGYWTSLMTNGNKLKTAEFESMLELYIDAHPPLPAGMSIALPFAGHCLLITIPSTTTEEYENAYELLHAFDLLAWIDATGGIVLLRFSPSTWAKWSHPGCPLTGMEKLAAGEGPVAGVLAPVAANKSGVIPGAKARTKSSGNNKMWRVITFEGGCSKAHAPEQHVLLWSTDAQMSCQELRTEKVCELANLPPDERAKVVRDAFTNPQQYVSGHWHYRTRDFEDFKGTDQSKGQKQKFTMSEYTERFKHKDVAVAAGINTPWVYSNAKGARSVFGTHVEDLSLPSVNTLVHGEPKVWLAVAPVHESTVTAELMAKFNSSDLLGHQASCSQAVRQFNTLMPPAMLDQLDVTYAYAVQEAGDMVYVSPNTLHCGINWGGNLAVALNLEGPGARGVGCCCKAKFNAMNCAHPLFRG